jgi:hypothetical protein
MRKRILICRNTLVGGGSAANNASAANLFQSFLSNHFDMDEVNGMLTASPHRWKNNPKRAENSVA